MGLRKQGGTTRRQQGHPCTASQLDSWPLAPPAHISKPQHPHHADAGSIPAEAPSSLSKRGAGPPRIDTRQMWGGTNTSCYHPRASLATPRAELPIRGQADLYVLDWSYIKATSPHPTRPQTSPRLRRAANAESFK